MTSLVIVRFRGSFARSTQHRGRKKRIGPVSKKIVTIENEGVRNRARGRMSACGGPREKGGIELSVVIDDGAGSGRWAKMMSRGAG